MKTTVEKRPFRTGFCGRTMPASSHGRCPKAIGNQACTCECHAETGDPSCCTAEDHALGVHRPGHTPATG